MFLGIFLSQENRQQEAISDLTQKPTLNPDNVEALTWLGTVELAVGHPEEAVAPLDHAAKLKPDDLDSNARMARINPALQAETDGRF
ncbi:tetratricopeptide repeat protein [Edaphobacter sp.]|uniref:tetratricopeptide repeat protein n=1 Tax=Edaphobacter sp. TaxID=1934404 RepID=UPI002DB5A684|nr:tetratricopeptide repeat protein [Edaphobacter sp.]HEU5341590.1 tetratricopeptide repeat protein [Edaphobacter sp.]